MANSKGMTRLDRIEKVVESIAGYQVQHEERQLTLERNMDKLTATMTKLAATMAKLADALVVLTARVDRLAETVDRFIKGRTDGQEGGTE
jgi:hypothetical protein